MRAYTLDRELHAQYWSLDARESDRAREAVRDMFRQTQVPIEVFDMEGTTLFIVEPLLDGDGEPVDAWEDIVASQKASHGSLADLIDDAAEASDLYGDDYLEGHG